MLFLHRVLVTEIHSLKNRTVLNKLTALRKRMQMKKKNVKVWLHEMDQISVFCT